MEGRNLAVERRSCESKTERASEIMAEVVRLKVDVIVTTVNPVARAAKEAMTSIPIVMTSISGPVEYGCCQSRAPGRQCNRAFRRHGPRTPHETFVAAEGDCAAHLAGAFVGTNGVLELAGARAVEAAALAPAFAVVTRERADAIFAAWNPTNYFHRRDIIEFAAKNRLPARYAFRQSAQDGGLMSRGIDRADLIRRAAGYVGQILRGAKPPDLPIQEPITLEFLINLRTAKALGLTVPPSLLQWRIRSSSDGSASVHRWSHRSLGRPARCRGAAGESVSGRFLYRRGPRRGHYGRILLGACVNEAT